MPELLLALTIATFVLFWKHVWQKSLLDRTRDRLFDLRDELRSWFLEHGYGLEHPVYKELRLIINSHLRHTEKATITSYFAFMDIAQRNAKYEQELKNKVDSVFNAGDAKIRDFAQYIRLEACRCLIVQMLFRSSFCSLLLIPISVFIICRLLVYWLIEKFSYQETLQPAVATAIIVGIISVFPAFRGSPSTVENYSFSANATETVRCS